MIIFNFNNYSVNCLCYYPNLLYFIYDKWNINESTNFKIYANNNTFYNSFIF